MSRSSPLDVIQVPEPCHQPWEWMTGDDRKRFCTGCQKHVHNLSAMPRDEAERLVCEGAAGLCIRYEQGPDGTPLTLEYQKAGRIRGGWRLWTAVGAIGACMAGAVQALVTGRPAAPATTRSVVAGMMVMPPPPPQQSSANHQAIASGEASTGTGENIPPSQE